MDVLLRMGRVGCYLYECVNLSDRVPGDGTMEWATLAGPVESELLIKKSRFLGRVMPVSGRAEAYAEVARLKALHAQHHPRG